MVEGFELKKLIPFMYQKDLGCRVLLKREALSGIRLLYHSNSCSFQRLNLKAGGHKGDT